jgi:hypothetical protein
MSLLPELWLPVWDMTRMRTCQFCQEDIKARRKHHISLMTGGRECRACYAETKRVSKLQGLPTHTPWKPLKSGGPSSNATSRPQTSFGGPGRGRGSSLISDTDQWWQK